ncbi:MAG: thioredoxin family protein [Bacteroidia bacterium]|nr:thioredoxin family protein [Bacteroidia bacterium]
MTKHLLSTTLAFFLFAITTQAQIKSPVKWTFGSAQSTGNRATLKFTAIIDKYWHIYSIKQPEGAGVKTHITFTKNANIKLIGTVTEPKPHKEYDDLIDSYLITHEGKPVFTQEIEVLSKGKQIITGELEFMACDTVACSPPEIIQFSIPVEGATETLNVIDTSVQNTVVTNASGIEDTTEMSQTNIENNNTTPPEKTRSSWGLLVEGFIAGLAALLTPCVFPMIPMTVSFFTKRSKTRAKGISNALLYAASIIFIYLTLGLGVSKLFGPDALNALSTNVYFNIAFFVLLIVFALSFLGAFEIVLPSSFVNKMDAQSDRGGLIGIFFMAFSLSLVSFSCTGPIVGSVLVDSATSGAISGPFWVMLGFGSALALPFGLFAAFPGWLNSLPKSGGWLNSVKVVLGFLEIALALKFLSNADLVTQAGYITREVFLSIWIAVFGLLTAYLLGVFKTAHDSELKFISVPRLLFAIISFSFTVYLIPGLTSNAPLQLIAGFPPPDFYSEATMSGNNNIATVNTVATTQKEHCPNNLPCYHDYDEALKEAKKQQKPLMIDFTGWACVNCRKMENSVWKQPEIDKLLRSDVVLVSLYVDDKTELPAAEQTIKKLGDRDFTIKTIGNKWSYLQASVYKTNTQPMYILLDNNEQMLNAPKHYDPNAKAYQTWLIEGIEKMKQ